MKSKTWHAVATTAKHWTHNLQQPQVYQHSFASLSSIRPHLPASAAAGSNTNNNENTNAATIIINDTTATNENNIYNYNYTNRKNTLQYYPIYKQPGRRSLSTSISLSSAATNALAHVQAVSTAYDITSPQQEHQHIPFYPHLSNKSLPLLDFFASLMQNQFLPIFSLMVLRDLQNAEIDLQLPIIIQKSLQNHQQQQMNIIIVFK